MKKKWFWMEMSLPFISFRWRNSLEVCYMEMYLLYFPLFPSNLEFPFFYFFSFCFSLRIVQKSHFFFSFFLSLFKICFFKSFTFSRVYGSSILKLGKDLILILFQCRVSLLSSRLSVLRFWEEYYRVSLLESDLSGIFFFRSTLTTSLSCF